MSRLNTRQRAEPSERARCSSPAASARNESEARFSHIKCLHLRRTLFDSGPIYMHVTLYVCIYKTGRESSISLGARVDNGDCCCHPGRQVWFWTVCLVSSPFIYYGACCVCICGLSASQYYIKGTAASFFLYSILSARVCTHIYESPRQLKYFEGTMRVWVEKSSSSARSHQRAKIWRLFELLLSAAYKINITSDLRTIYIFCAHYLNFLIYTMQRVRGSRFFHSSPSVCGDCGVIFDDTK